MTEFHQNALSVALMLLIGLGAGALIGALWVLREIHNWLRGGK